MSGLKPAPRIKLSRLRDIGWTLWDPIGLLPSGESWQDKDNLSFADEYDSYLISAASQLRAGKSRGDVSKYLYLVEAEHMGLGNNADREKAAIDVVSAIDEDAELWTWPDSNGTFADP